MPSAFIRFVFQAVLTLVILAEDVIRIPQAIYHFLPASLRSSVYARQTGSDFENRLGFSGPPSYFIALWHV